MNKNKKILFVIILLAIIATLVALIAFFLGKKKYDSSKGSTEKFTVVTSFYPMYIACMNICEGADIELKNLSEPKTGCLHDYQLTTDDMKLLSTADVFVVNGGGIEEFLEEVTKSYPDLTIINASENIEIEEGNAHVWMSVSKHIKQVENITDGLAKADVSNAERYYNNGFVYARKLNSLLTKVDKAYEGKKVVLFSEAYQYLADDFGAKVLTVLDLDEEKEVGAKELSETVDLIRNKGANTIWAEKKYGEKMAKIVMAETNVNTIYLDTITRGDYDKDAYVSRMSKNINLINAEFE